MKQWFANLSMYRLMVYYLGALVAAAIVFSALEILPYVWWHILANLIIIRLSCLVVNRIFSKIFNTKPYVESELITALILTLIVGPVDPLSISNLVFLSTVAAFSQASKYLLAINKKHIFNPAAVAVFLTALIMNQGASWWVGDRHLIWIMVIGGFLILKKLGWFHLSLSFLGVYVAGIIFMNGLALDYLAILSPLLFFATVMLIEPATAPSGQRNRILYGIFIAAILTLLINYSTLPFTLELALLIGNLLFWFTKIKYKLVLKFIQKKSETVGVQSFLFEPQKKLNFIPGQFLQWTLPHPHADNRGERRWFTIASSPTENQIQLTTKFFDKPSSFKQTLNELRSGTEIAVSDPDGDFVLPKNPTAKLVLIAGGIGITPFRSMIKYLVDTKQSRDVILLYTAKTADEFCFRELFTQAEQIGLKTQYLETSKTGFLTPEFIQQEIPDWADRVFYVSGPEPMVESYQTMLKQTGVRDAGIKTDFFPGYE